MLSGCRLHAMSTVEKTQTEVQPQQKKLLKAPAVLANETGGGLAATRDTIPEGEGFVETYASIAPHPQVMLEPEVTPEGASEEAAAGDQALPASAGVEAPARMARFVLPDGVTLEIHIPRATGVGTGDSAATEAGFILRRGAKLVNVGPLGRVLGL